MTAKQIRGKLEELLAELERDAGRVRAALAALTDDGPAQQQPKPPTRPTRAGKRPRRKLAKRMPPAERDKVVLGIVGSRNGGSMTKEQVAKALGWTKGTTEKCIARLRRDKQLELVGRNQYRLPESKGAAVLDLGTAGRTRHPADPDAQAMRTSLVHTSEAPREEVVRR